ncbi:hypothetical protein [Nocardia cyriacigeorgica]|uniref:hypothetical protein n=1 Tax=Nocardia cyriacigeorgica TaxID=135487 RepID=UPI0024572533|nr:hypothetical protein [Nocardia cyriacigeorgica]
MSDPNCTPVLTPTDCGPTATPEPAQMPTFSPEPPPGFPEIPAPPPIDQWHLPDASSLGEIAGNSAVVGFVIIAILIMTVAVAYLWPLEPHRLRNFAVAALALPVASVVAGGSWTTPLSVLWSGAETLAGGDWSGLAPMLVVALPAGMLAATYFWANFLLKTNTVGLKSLGRTERVQDAMAARRARAAARAARLGAPHSAGAAIVLGTLADRTSSKPVGLWRELAGRHQHWLTVPHADTKRHQALFGTTGSGKTELIKRYAVGLFDYEYRAWHRWKDVPAAGGKHPRPLLVMITCKGGEDDRVLGLQMRDALTRMGVSADRFGLVVPGFDRMDIWTKLPARDMRAILEDLLMAGESSTSEGQHFDEMRKRIVSLVVDAPIGPPRSSEEFLARLDEHKLKDIWSNAPDVVRQVDALQAEKVPQIDDALIKCSNLFDLLKDHDGAGVFDGGKDLDDLDLLYMTVPALDKDAARAQVAATLRLVMQRAGRTAKDQRRSVTVFLDEASALTTKKGSIGLEDIAERGRSQGVALVFSGQAPESLAADPWSLNRLLKACAGGVLIGYCENVGDLCKHVGSVRTMLPSRHLIKGQRTGDEGQVSVGEKWLVDPDRVRQFDTGDFVFAKKGRAWFGRVVPIDLANLNRLPGTEPADPAPAQTAAAAPA